MNADDIFGMNVVDASGKNIGKIDDIDIDNETGIAKQILINFKKGLFSKKEEKIAYDQIDNIKDVVLLKIDVKKDIK